MKLEIKNNMKLEIKNLAPYLPYGIDAMFDGRIYGQIVGIDVSSLLYEIKVIEGFDNNTPIYKRWCVLDTKPILRPLSDLTKEIEHNGEKFVPIEWLFNNLVDDTDVIDFDYEFKEEIKPSFQIDDGWNHCMTLINDYGHSVCFSYDSNSNSFMLGIESRPGVEWCMISNQYEMFQKLFEWHFDIFGLIENNLAININKIQNENHS